MKRRSFAAVVLTGALAASLVAFSAGPASAGVCSGDVTNAPDARLRHPNGTWSGGGVYPSVASGSQLGPGLTATFGVEYRNVSNATQSIRVRNFSFEKFGDLKIKLFVNGENVTRKFRGTGKGITFKNVAAGKRTPVLEIRYINPAGQPVGRQNVLGYYKGSPTQNCDAAFTGVNTP